MSRHPDHMGSPTIDLIAWTAIIGAVGLFLGYLVFLAAEEPYVPPSAGHGPAEQVP